jgi:hypothetical protein
VITRRPLRLRAWLAVVIVLWIAGAPAHAQDEVPPVYEGVVTQVVEHEMTQSGNQTQHYQRLELRLETGPAAGTAVVADASALGSGSQGGYEVGERVLVSPVSALDPAQGYFVLDPVRRGPLYALFLGFVVVTVVVGRRRPEPSRAGSSVARRVGKS